MPNKGIFPKKIRPKGLEFPCCLDCNQGTKWAEDTVAFVSSVRFRGSNLQNEHFETKLQHLIRNHPDILNALEPTARQKRANLLPVDEHGNSFGVFDLRAPLVSHALLLYGAKLGIGLHWEQSKDVLSTNAKVAVMCFSNANAINDDVPQHLFDLLPEIKTLRQGTKNSSEIFEYGSGKTADGTSSCHWTALGDALLYFIFVGENLDTTVVPEKDIFRPGCFAKSKPNVREWLPVSAMGPWSVMVT